MLDGSLDEVVIGLTNWWGSPIPKGQPGAGQSMRDRVMQWTPLYVEEKLIVELPSGREWTAVIDAVYDTGGGIVPVDQKSAKNFNRYPLDGKGLGSQSTTYAELLRIVFGWDVDRFEYHIARVEDSGSTHASYQRARIVQVSPKDEDRVKLTEDLQKAESIIDAGLFPKTRDWFLCSPAWCPFHVGAGGPCDPQSPQEFDLKAFAAPS